MGRTLCLEIEVAMRNWGMPNEAGMKSASLAALA
jgi:hypothetical protein